MLIAGQTWRAAVLHSVGQSRSLLAVLPLRRAARPGGAAALPASVRTLDVELSDSAVVPSTGRMIAAKADPSGLLVDATVSHDRNSEYIKETQFFVRVADGSRTDAGDEKYTYVAQRWPWAA